MKHITSFALAALAAGALAAPAAAQSPASVDVQVEGAAGALVPTTTVTTTTAPVNKDGQAGHDCTGTSVAGALERATAGDWGGTWSDGLGYGVERIRTETYPFGSQYQGRYFAQYVNGRPSSAGACGTELQTGDDVLFYVTCAGASTGCYAGEPLFATAPRTVAPGAPFTVTVEEAATTYGGPPDFAATTTLTPSQGASVNGATTGADGTARVTLAERGLQLVTATKGDRPPERVPVCVTDGADGFCGTTKPGAAAPATPAPAPASTTVRARFTSVADGEVFPKGGGPAFLRGTVVSPGAGIDDVRLRLTRTDRGRCFAFDPVRERQVRRRRCGARGGIWFSVGDRAQFEYQLPFTTPRGRWVLDVQVRDRAGRYSRLERGNTRAVFTVR